MRGRPVLYFGFDGEKMIVMRHIPFVLAEINKTTMKVGEDIGIWAFHFVFGRILKRSFGGEVGIFVTRYSGVAWNPEEFYDDVWH